MGNILKSKKGDLPITVMAGMIIGIVTLFTLLSFFNVIMEWQQVNYMAKTVTEEIEIEGGVTASIIDEFDQLQEQLGIPARLTVDAVYLRRRQIQYRDPFTVTVEADVEFVIMRPAWSDSAMSVIIPMRVTLTGKSQVYWK